MQLWTSLDEVILLSPGLSRRDLDRRNVGGRSVATPVSVDHHDTLTVLSHGADGWEELPAPYKCFPPDQAPPHPAAARCRTIFLDRGLVATSALSFLAQVPG
mmetsp:Transcript_17614/g.38235  ORF Transcript_17614/g.38235 Transcript_17614/m.38235 type:complete len:102 (+) Transcript_17614:267-572(+)